jgi:HEAT repeat protein
MMAIRHIGLYGKGHKNAVDFLIEMTKDKYALVQLAAAHALGLTQDERAIPALEELIKEDHDSRLQRTAEEAIRAIYPWLETDMERPTGRARPLKRRKNNFQQEPTGLFLFDV